MNDVIIIGGSDIGKALAAELMEKGIKVIMVDARSSAPENWEGEWLEGIGVVSGPELVSILDPVSADERRLVQGRSIVIATGPFDPAKPSGRMLGITKLGAEFTEDGQFIRVDSRGRTPATGIYAAGKCASQNTPGIAADLLNYRNSNSSTS